MSAANYDYSAYVDNDEAQGEDGLAQLAALAEAQFTAQEEVLAAERELEAAKERLRDISERLIPEKMEALGLEDFKTKTGLKISVKEVVRTSIPKARTAEAFAWLRLKGFEALIKRKVSVDFGRGEDAQAEELSKILSDKGLVADDNSTVHPQTLKAFVVEQLKNGEEFPLDLFGVHRQRVAVIG